MFSHDGIKDSFTRLAAPPLFYEELRRELSRFERSGDPFSLIRLVLLTGAKNQYRQESDEISRHEVEILNFTETLIRLSRSEDLCARIGEREFAVLLRGSESVAKNLIDRVTNEWLAAIGMSVGDLAYPDFSSAHLSPQSGESALGLLNRLDRQPLISYLVRFRANDRTSRY